MLAPAGGRIRKQINKGHGKMLIYSWARPVGRVNGNAPKFSFTETKNGHLSTGGGGGLNDATPGAMVGIDVSCLSLSLSPSSSCVGDGAIALCPLGDRPVGLGAAKPLLRPAPHQQRRAFWPARDRDSCARPAPSTRLSVWSATAGRAGSSRRSHMARLVARSWVDRKSVV